MPKIKITAIEYSVSGKSIMGDKWYNITGLCNEDKVIFFQGEGCGGFLKELIKRCKKDGGEVRPKFIHKTKTKKNEQKRKKRNH